MACTRARDLRLLGADGDSNSSAAESPRKIEECSPVPAAHVQNGFPSAELQQFNTVIQQLKLSLLGRLVIEKQPVVDVVAPKSAVNESERVVMLANFLGSRH